MRRICVLPYRKAVKYAVSGLRLSGVGDNVLSLPPPPRMRTYYSPPAFTLCMRKSLAKLCPVNWLICWQYACIWLAMSSDSRRLGCGMGLKRGLLVRSSSGSASSPLLG